MRVILYTGKGGVGKTTSAAATALGACLKGTRTIVVSADPAHSLADVLDLEVGAAPTPIRPGLDAIELDPRAELERQWGRVRDYLVSLFRHQGIEEVVAEELALLPGAEELTALTAVDELARGNDYDLVVVDCAPTDSTLRLLTFPDLAHGAIRTLLKLQRAIARVATPLAANLVAVPLPDSAVFRDAEHLAYDTLHRLRERLSHADTSVRLVVTPERMVIDEARRAFTDLSLFGIACDLVVMNRFLPEAATREPFFRDWGRIQAERLEEVEAHFAPLPVLTAPLQDDEAIGLAALEGHARSLFGERHPGDRYGTLPGIAFTRAGAGYEISMPLPGADRAALDVVMVEDDLIVRVGGQRRAVRLPRRIAAQNIDRASLRDGALTVTFTPGDAPPPIAGGR